MRSRSGFIAPAACGTSIGWYDTRRFYPITVEELAEHAPLALIELTSEALPAAQSVLGEVSGGRLRRAATACGRVAAGGRRTINPSHRPFDHGLAGLRQLRS